MLIDLFQKLTYTQSSFIISHNIRAVKNIAHPSTSGVMWFELFQHCQKRHRNNKFKDKRVTYCFQKLQQFFAFIVLDIRMKKNVKHVIIVRMNPGLIIAFYHT